MANGARGSEGSSTTSPNTMVTRKLYDVPEEGLAEVLRGWSSRGNLYTALAAVAADDWSEIRWTADDIRRRAHRIWFAELAPLLESWPTSPSEWLERLPAESHRSRRTASAPVAGVDWTATRLRGWPPDQFVIRDRSRIADQVMLRTLRWVIDRLDRIRRDAIRVECSVRDLARQQIEAALSLSQMAPLNHAVALRPSRAELNALRRSGFPWTTLVPVAEALRRDQYPDLMDLARRHIMPDEDLRWRLFHLAVFGIVLKALRTTGAALTSLRPLSASLRPGPHYEVRTSEGEVWDLWFEANAMWAYYGHKSAYSELAVAFARAPAVLGADIALIRPGVMAYLFECKYGDSHYVGRDGYHQINTYLSEATNTLVPCAVGYLVGPDEIVVRQSSTATGSIHINIVGPRHLRDFRLS